MEFLAGIIFTLFFEFIGYKIWIAREKRRARKAYIPPSGPRPGSGPRDYPGSNQDNPE